MRYGRSKYGVRTDAKGIEDRTCDNIVFHSRKECIRYQELRASFRAGIITHLKLQVKFLLMVGNTRLGDYVCDFAYYDRDNNYVIEDSKGVSTPLYKWKKKHFEAQYGLRILES